MSNLKSHINGNTVVGSICQQLRHPSGWNRIWIIVEGMDDQKLFSKLIDGPHIKFEFNPNGWGKISLLKAVAELLKETDSVLGIRDADFLHLEGKEESVENIFLTDFHDAEMMVASCDEAYHAVAAEYVVNREEEPLILRKKILRSIAFIGGLRWINDSDNLELNFKGLGFGNFYDAKTLALDESNCLNEIIKRSPSRKKDISIAAIQLKINNISDFLNLCNGHDFQKAFALCVSFNTKKRVSYAEIGKVFRIAYRFEDFQKSNLYKQLKERSDAQSWSLFKQT